MYTNAFKIDGGRFTVGNTLSFDYEGKTRFCRIESVKKNWSMFLGDIIQNITGWDITANNLIGGYRTFKREKIQNVRIV